MAEQQTDIQLYTIGEYILNKSIETNQEITFDDATVLFEDRLNKTGVSIEERTKLDYYAKLPDGININAETLIVDFNIIKVNDTYKLKRFLVDLEEIPKDISFNTELGLQYSSDTCQVFQYEEIINGKRYKKLRYMIDKTVCFRILVKSRISKYSKYFSLMWQFLAVYREYQSEFKKWRDNNSVNHSDGYVSIDQLYMVEEELEKYKKNTLDAIRERDSIRSECDAALAECIKIKGDYEIMLAKSKKLKSKYDDRMSELLELNNDLKMSRSLLGQTEDQLKARAFLSTLNPTKEGKHHYFVATMMPTIDANNREVFVIKFISGQQDYIDVAISNFKYQCELRDVEPQFLIPKMYCANGIDLRNNFHAYYNICIRRFVKDHNDANREEVLRFNNILRHEIWQNNPTMRSVDKEKLFHERRLYCKFIRITDIDRYVSFNTTGIKIIKDNRLPIDLEFIKDKMNYIIEQTQIANIPSDF